MVHFSWYELGSNLRRFVKQNKSQVRAQRGRTQLLAASTTHARSLANYPVSPTIEKLRGHLVREFFYYLDDRGSKQ